MIFLTAAAAFGFVGLASAIEDRHVAAIHNFAWCLAHCFFPKFPQ
ncbi:MAG: hypothetical protein WC003_01160 [Terrimicrobiaceae bacterium]